MVTSVANIVQADVIEPTADIGWRIGKGVPQTSQLGPMHDCATGLECLSVKASSLYAPASSPRLMAVPAEWCTHHNSSRCIQRLLGLDAWDEPAH